MYDNSQHSSELKVGRLKAQMILRNTGKLKKYFCARVSTSNPCVLTLQCELLISVCSE